MLYIMYITCAFVLLLLCKWPGCISNKWSTHIILNWRLYSTHSEGYTVSIAVQDVGVIVVVTNTGVVHVALQWCSRQYIPRRTASRHQVKGVPT